MVLDQIMAGVRQRLAEKKEQVPLAELKPLVGKHGPPRDFRGALQGEGIKIIAEIKRASPSKGWLCSDINVASLVRSYTRGGAAAVSVLTEQIGFKGSLDDLAEARQATRLPLLAKCFILDPYQVYEARVYGADAVLLIAATLSSAEMSQLIELTRALGMAALVEVHTEKEVERALKAKANLIGVNNRNLADFTVDLRTTFRLRPLIPPEITVVSESGIRSFADASALQKAGINAILVGETLVTSGDPEARIKELRGEHR
ncbi:MAG: indole-3-glycerol phosphate synthase TrpC [Chloroflexi bacterium]|nr:indole-3-glycerol phosphate synthase TrpC [Chloroflexota bacterium]